MYAFLYAILNSTNKLFLYVLFNVFTSMPADRAQANQGVGKLPKRIPASLRPLLPEMGGKHCRERPRGNTESEIKHLIQENSKPQDLIVHTVYIVSPKTSQGGASLSSKVRLSSMKTVQSIRSQSPA